MQDAKGGPGIARLAAFPSNTMLPKDSTPDVIKDPAEPGVTKPLVTPPDSPISSDEENSPAEPPPELVPVTEPGDTKKGS